jgi:hypothetical protein
MGADGRSGESFPETLDVEVRDGMGAESEMLDAEAKDVGTEVDMAAMEMEDVDINAAGIVVGTADCNSVVVGVFLGRVLCSQSIRREMYIMKDALSPPHP